MEPPSHWSGWNWTESISQRDEHKDYGNQPCRVSGDSRIHLKLFSLQKQSALWQPTTCSLARTQAGPAWLTDHCPQAQSACRRQICLAEDWTSRCFQYGHASQVAHYAFAPYWAEGSSERIQAESFCWTTIIFWVLSSERKKKQVAGFRKHFAALQLDPSTREPCSSLSLGSGQITISLSRNLWRECEADTNHQGLDGCKQCVVVSSS